MHLGGKIEVKSRFPITYRDELSMAYTPGVARVCMAIHEKPEKVHNLTIKNNTVAIVTDGSAVLAQGNIDQSGASMPVMEGKAMLLKEFAGVNAFPICLNTQDTNEIIETVKRISPSFGAVNLEIFQRHVVSKLKTDSVKNVIFRYSMMISMAQP